MSDTNKLKIGRANIAAARALKDILERRHEAVPENTQKLTALDPDMLPKSNTSAHTGGQNDQLH